MLLFTLSISLLYKKNYRKFSSIRVLQWWLTLKQLRTELIPVVGGLITAVPVPRYVPGISECWPRVYVGPFQCRDQAIYCSEKLSSIIVFSLVSPSFSMCLLSPVSQIFFVCFSFKAVFSFGGFSKHSFFILFSTYCILFLSMLYCS